MTREEAKAFIKPQLESYLRDKGIDTRKNFKCLAGTHTDNNPSMSLDTVNNQAHCFSCGAKFDIFDFIGRDYNLEPAQAFQRAYEMYGITLEGRTSPQKPIIATKDNPPCQDSKGPPQPATSGQNYSEYVAKCKEAIKSSPEALAYIQGRGLAGVIERLGYDAQGKRIIIPYDAAGNYYIARTIGGKEYRKATGPEPLYNAEALYNGSGAVFVTEGALDALSIIEAGGEAVALNGTAHAKLLAQLEKRRTSNTLIISLDNDEAGRTATEKLQGELGARKIDYITANISGENKDANEALIANRGQLETAIKDTLEGIEALRQAKREADIEDYKQENSAFNHIQAFLDGIKIDTPAIPTGFKELDKALDGGLYEGLYILGAISSLGKTTFALQIADWIAQQGNDVLIFSLEMARAELMAKSISRITFLNCNGKPNNAKTTRGITARQRHEDYSTEEKRLINDSIERYGEYAKNLYISEGLGSIGAEEVGEAVRKHISITGKKPVVIIDYLQILKAAEPRSTDKQNTDKAVFMLKRISREYKIPIIGISSLNRDSYKQKISMAAFKESGAIEYSSDVLIGLQFQEVNTREISEEMIDSEKRKTTREIELKILKNRNGQTGAQINYDFISMFNYFKETGTSRGTIE